MGVAPSGREITNRVIVIHRIVEGKIAEEWGMVNVYRRNTEKTAPRARDTRTRAHKAGA